MSYPAISLTTATVSRHRRPPKAPAERRQPTIYPDRARTIASVTSSPPFQCPRAVHPCPSVDSGLTEMLSAGYTRVKVSDRVKERPTLEVDPATAPVVREVFESSLQGNGLKEICKALNGRGVTNRGNRWYKGGLHYLLNNEAYTGTAVWGRTSKGEKTQDPVRVEGAWPRVGVRGSCSTTCSRRCGIAPRRCRGPRGLAAGSC